MKLYIKQKVFSWGDKFSVLDENGDSRYYVEGKVFSLAKQLHVKDNFGNEVAFIKQKAFSLLPRFYVYKDEIEVAEIVKQFTFLRQKYSISKLGWQVDGDFGAHNYQLLNSDGSQIAIISKRWLSWGDTYEIEITDLVDEVITLAVVLAIDCVLAANSAAAAN